MFGWCLCRLLEVRCDRSQRSGPQLSARLQGKVARGNLIWHQRPWRLQSSCYGWIGRHGLQLWSSGQNLPLPFCAPQFGSLLIFLFGHSAQNYTVCNWISTLCLISDGQNRLALWGAEKGCWWFVGYFDLLLFQTTTYFLGNALYIRQHYKALKLFSASCLVNALSQFRIKDMG